MTERDDIEDQLVKRLAELASALDPVPDRVSDFARAAFTLRDLDAELAALVSDSSLDAAAVRSQTDPVRVLSFSVGGVVCDIEVRTGPPRSLIGELFLADDSKSDHPGPFTVQVEDTQRRAHPAVTVDNDGRFELADLPSGPFRLRFTGPHGDILTSWTG